MSNWRKHTNSSQIEVYSVELDCNTNRCHNETPSGHDEAETETARNKKKASIQAWADECSNKTRESVQDAWLKMENIATSSKNTMNQCVSRMQDSLGFQHFYAPIIVAFAIASTTLFTLWPQHNGILHPEYWYEILSPMIIFYFCTLVPLTITELYTVMKVDDMFTWNKYIKLCLSHAFGFGIPYVLLYLVWVSALDYHHPIPFLGQICMVISQVTKVVTLWFLFPEDLRTNNHQFRQQIICYTMTFPVTTMISLGYSNLSSLFNIIPMEFQWCVAVFLPAVKEFNLWMYTKLLYKAAGSQTQSATIAGICYIGSIHMFALISLLDSKFEHLTEYLIMICDCIPNIWSCRKIIQLNKQGRHMNDDKNRQTECLVLEETIEVFVPLVYFTSFLVAYFGPNATILGNVYNDWWQFEKVDSLTEKLTNVSISFVIDVVQGIILGFTLYKFCQMNLYEVYLSLFRDYGPLICLFTSCHISLVRYQF